MSGRIHPIMAAWLALDSCESRADQHAAWDRLCELRTRERNRFAASRGWVAVPRFTTGHLIGLRGRRARDLPGSEDIIRHRSCFSTDVGADRPKKIALVTHVYDGPKRCIEFADKFSLAVEIVPSWYLPGLTTAVLFTFPD